MDADAWWKMGVIYQIYPRSFQDTDGDGVGDLKGIARRLDHLVALGIDAMWISPIFRSPMRDFGYDVSDYCDIDPLFGSLEDFDALLTQTHAHGLKLILDLVPNHTSDRHPWFVESRSSKDNLRRDWYVWRDPKPDGSPPNNWESEFGGPAWTLDAPSGQYFYHAYLREQPDLNWRNPEVERALCDVMRFWFARGVDGFRVDACHRLYEDEQLRDNPTDPYWRPGMDPTRRLVQLWTKDQPETQASIQRMRSVADEYQDKVMIGEAFLPIDRMMAYYGANLTGFQLPFNFHLISTPWRPPAIAALIEAYESALPAGAWPNWVLGNHDRPRVVSRIGPKQARVAAMLLLTLRGTPTIYQGEEIGMSDVAVAAAQAQDPFGRNVPGLGRDPARTPMPWDTGDSAGFTEARPWLPLNSDATALNVEEQAADPRSMLWLYRALIRLRRSHPALANGAIRLLAATEHILAYERRIDREVLKVLLNMSDLPRCYSLGAEHEALLSTHLDTSADQTIRHVTLRADEGLVVREIAGSHQAGQ